jgi:GGDEF domain-containing protein
MVTEELNLALEKDLHFLERYGGEEFAVVVPNCSEEDVRVGRKLRRTIEGKQLPH